MVDCTGSMSGSIDAVKNNILNIQERLKKDYVSCDLRFSFVRYTDFDQPESTMTTWLDFTEYDLSYYVLFCIYDVYLYIIVIEYCMY